jgi:mitochondrial fission protein ELM1
LTEIINSVQGFDVNPIAGFIAAANYILAIGDLIDEESECAQGVIFTHLGQLPIFAGKKWDCP